MNNSLKGDSDSRFQNLSAELDKANIAVDFIGNTNKVSYNSIKHDGFLLSPRSRFANTLQSATDYQLRVHAQQRATPPPGCHIGRRRGGRRGASTRARWRQRGSPRRGRGRPSRGIRCRHQGIPRQVTSGSGDRTRPTLNGNVTFCALGVSSTHLSIYSSRRIS